MKGKTGSSSGVAGFKFKRASGGAVAKGDDEGKPEKAVRMSGTAPTPRLDRPQRARGGAMKRADGGAADNGKTETNAKDAKSNAIIGGVISGLAALGTPITMGVPSAAAKLVGGMTARRAGAGAGYIASHAPKSGGSVPVEDILSYRALTTAKDGEEDRKAGGRVGRASGGALAPNSAEHPMALTAKKNGGKC